MIRKLMFHGASRIFYSVFATSLIAFCSSAYAVPLATDQINTSHRFRPAAECGECHMTQFQQWRSSIMGYSSLSPVIHALELTENHTSRSFVDENGNAVTVPFGRFARSEVLPKNGANQTTGATELFCQKCHAPIAVFADLFETPSELFSDHPDSNFNAQNRGAVPDAHMQILAVKSQFPVGSAEYNTAVAASEGVTCSVCHRINGRNEASNAPGNGPRPGFEPGIANSGYLYESAQGRYFGPFNDTNSITNIGVFNGNFQNLQLTPGHFSGAVQINDANGEIILGNDGVARPYIKTGEFCGSCHDVRIPMPDMATIPQEPFRRVENLFSEWRNSPWNNNNNNNENIPEDDVFVNALDNPRDPAVDLNGNPVALEDEFTNNVIKQITTCQDCHMSNYMIDPDAKPGEYQMGKVSNGSEERKISNHRFIGVDRVLVDYSSVQDLRKNLVMDSNGNIEEQMTSGIPDIAAITHENKGEFPDLNVDSIAPGMSPYDAREVLLQKAVDFNIVAAEEKNNELEVMVTAENVGAGHNIPAGLSQERQVWIELEVLDRDGQHVYTSGFLQPIEKFEENPAIEEFLPYDEDRYSQSYCGKNNGELEYLCDLDNFRAKLENNLEITRDGSGKLEYTEDSLDTQLVNYQNGFTLEREGGRKVFSQFIGDAINNGNALKPFEKRKHTYTVNTSGHRGPFQVNARLRFRPLPHEFLAALKRDDQEFASSRVTDEVIAANKIIEMENDSCVSAPYSQSGLRACSPVNTLALGYAASCAVLENKSAQCWGFGYRGKLADGDVSNHSVAAPRQVKGLENIEMISLGDRTGCALQSDGTVSCWGGSNTGALGDGDLSYHTVGFPAQVSPQHLMNVKMIASGAHHNCALLEEGGVKCWGIGVSLGIGSEDNKAIPAQISSNKLSNVTMIAAGGYASCAIIDTGEVKCWGYGQKGQIGNGSMDDALTPKAVVGLNYPAKYIAVGFNHACAALENDQVKCWGNDAYGQLGDGEVGGVSTIPTVVQGLLDNEGNRETVSQLALGMYHSCALLSDGKVKCWGQGNEGATGSQIRSDSGVAELVSGLPDSVSIAAGNEHTCAESKSGSIRCFGSNNYGQIGNGIQSSDYAQGPFLVLPYLHEDAEDEVLTLTDTGTETWTRTSGSTPSGNTGPSGGAGGSTNYYYMETSSYSNAFEQGDTAILESQAIDSDLLSQRNARLNFDYHMYGADIGTLYVDVFIHGHWVTNHWSRVGDQGNQWNSASFDLSGFDGLGDIKVRLRAKAKGGWQGDIAVDNIQLQLH